ncbi:16c37585-e81e-4bd5-aa74-8d25213f239d [Thermothielavioides terrestris]|uniref:16c37585-e81e-4bd5-aa74-8d25213f239d n=1 Tax=Thermothielavioides terrestris TaxID=2587410 RepID=A0A446BPG7_9PEZI|nr:16c37585-e81e-4bd5-aa74-8d25213f239d [Thermothielavioides terrestris]
MADFLPIPAPNPVDGSSQDQESFDTSDNHPTFSHAVATEAQDDHGHVQQHPEKDVLNLGWNERKEAIAAPLIGGMDNEELWMLTRRFNKQIYNVKATPSPPPGGLDLYIADDEEFSPDKLRANVERLYMTVGVGMLAAVKHVARLRSWRETQRTACFATAYFVAWIFDFLVPLLSAVLVALIGVPQIRGILFPPAPVALVDSKTGGVQKPQAGVLGSHDSATGAPEKHKGEAVEQEASSFVRGIASVAMGSAAGKHPQGVPDSDKTAAIDAAPDPTALATSTADAKDVASGGKTGAMQDKTKVPMETMMWNKMRPIMHTLGTIADTWERLANALSPIPLFPSGVYRLRLVAVILPFVFGASLFVTPYLFLKVISFFIGFLFFGDPILSRVFAWLNRTIPGWQKLFQPRNTLLKGVPTNAQLTLTLLRHGEAHNAPLPPPPRTTSPPPSSPAPLTDSHLRAAGTDAPLSATTAELNAATTPDTSPNPPPPPSADGGGGEADTDASPSSAEHGPNKPGSTILGLLKGTTKALVQLAVGTDTLRAKVGNKPARHRLGVIAAAAGAGGQQGTGGEPVEFEARYEGDKGRVYISGCQGGTVPVVAFAKGERAGTVRIAGREREDVRAEWSVPVAEVAELGKIGGR